MSKGADSPLTRRNAIDHTHYLPALLVSVAKVTKVLQRAESISVVVRRQFVVPFAHGLRLIRHFGSPGGWVHRSVSL
jgi:hypothetical protein